MVNRETREEHYIFIKMTSLGGNIFYSKFPCYNPAHYSKIMAIEFNIKSKNKHNKLTQEVLNDIN